MTVSVTIAVRHKVGLHARPATQFVKTANQYRSDVQVVNLTKGSRQVNAKSIVSVLSIGVGRDDEIQLTAAGEDKTAAIEALTALIKSNFGEDEAKVEEA
jgi:phosphotransferase system HPr (HPr) family protein